MPFIHHAKKWLSKTQKIFSSWNTTGNKQTPLKTIKGLKKEKGDTEHVVIDISTSSIVRGTFAIIGILVLIGFLYAIQSVLVLMIVSLIFAASMDPLVDTWQKHRVPRWLSVLIIYILLLLIFGMAVYSLVPLIIEQLITLSQNIGKFINNIIVADKSTLPFAKELKPFYHSVMDNIDKQQVISQLQGALSTVTSQLSNLAGNSLIALGVIFNGMLNALLVLVVTFFLVVDEKAIITFLHTLIPTKYATYYAEKTHQIRSKIGGWVRGQLILSLSVGIMTYIGLYLLQLFGVDIQYKETLSVFASITQVIPFIGPIFGIIPAILIAMNVSGSAFFAILILYFIVQMIENNVIVNIVMSKEVGLNPLIIILSLIIGGQFFGILGVVLAIPITTSIAVFVQDMINPTT